MTHYNFLNPLSMLSMKKCHMCCVLLIAPASESYRKLGDGSKCPTGKRIQSETVCKEAASELKLSWASSYSDKSDVPGCIFANDGRSKVYFNTFLAATGSNPRYAEICSGWFSYH